MARLLCFLLMIAQLFQMLDKYLYNNKIVEVDKNYDLILPSIRLGYGIFLDHSRVLELNPKFKDEFKKFIFEKGGSKEDYSISIKNFEKVKRVFTG